MATHRVPCPACGETPTLYSGCKCSSGKTIEGWKIIAEGLTNPLRNQLSEARETERLAARKLIQRLERPPFGEITCGDGPALDRYIKARAKVDELETKK